MSSEELSANCHVLLTGDNWAALEAVARSLGIDDVAAEILPEKKARRSTHYTIAMPGDGVNDGPHWGQPT